MDRVERKQGTRYVFAGSGAAESGPDRETSALVTTKICPRCGEELFADMDICYGCLYDFSKNQPEAPVRMGGVRNRNQGERRGFVLRDDPLATIELDEVDDESMGESEVTSLINVPRHSRSVSPDDTLDLSRQLPDPPPVVVAALDAPPTGYQVHIMSKDLELAVPLPPEGLAVGRGDDNDVILRSRLVSRHHMRITQQDGELVVHDCDATNPAIVSGKTLEGSAVLKTHDEIQVCDVTFVCTSIDG